MVCSVHIVYVKLVSQFFHTKTFHRVRGVKPEPDGRFMCLVALYRRHHCCGVPAASNHWVETLICINFYTDGIIEISAANAGRPQGGPEGIRSNLLPPSSVPFARGLVRPGHLGTYTVSAGCCRVIFLSL